MHTSVATAVVRHEMTDYRDFKDFLDTASEVELSAQRELILMELSAQDVLSDYTDALQERLEMLNRRLGVGFMH